MKNDDKKNSKKMPPNVNRSAESDSPNQEIKSELRQPVWSVVSFEQCAAKNLTYEEAVRKIADLEKQGISGLCLVTDAAAERLAAG